MKLRNVDLGVMDDLGLINLSTKGNMLAFTEIVERYQGLIARVIISMVGNEGADDIGQEVFIRFYKSMNNFKGDAKLSTYLTRIAINLSINELKKRSNNNIEEIRKRELLNQPENTEQITDVKQVIEYSLSKLEPEFRSVIILRNIEGYSTKETADILNIPSGTVLSRQSRGQKKLKEIITKLNIL